MRRGRAWTVARVTLLPAVLLFYGGIVLDLIDSILLEPARTRLRTAEIHELLESDRLVGRSRSEIEQVLGEPGSFELSLGYTLGFVEHPTKPQKLYVHFEEDGFVQYAYTRREGLCLPDWQLERDYDGPEWLFYPDAAARAQELVDAGRLRGLNVAQVLELLGQPRWFICHSSYDMSGEDDPWLFLRFDTEDRVRRAEVMRLD